MPTSYADALGDYDVAVQRLLDSRWADDAERRRALDAAMGTLYRLRNRAQAAVGGHRRYFEIVAASTPGQVAEAIVLVRGAADHDFLRDVEPRAAFVYPSEHTFPSPDLYPDDRNLFWRRRAELGYDLSAGESTKYRAAKEDYYDRHLAGTLVVHTFRVARLFFDGGQDSREWWPPAPE